MRHIIIESEKSFMARFFLETCTTTKNNTKKHKISKKTQIRVLVFFNLTKPLSMPTQPLETKYFKKIETTHTILIEK